MEQLKDRRTYGANPFLSTTNIVRGVKRELFKDKEHIITNVDTGEIGVGALLRTKRVDKDKFVKLYTDKLAYWLKLTKTGQRVLMYFITILRPNTDHVNVILDEAQEITGYTSIAPIYRGINELIELNIIARGRATSLYFINPSFIFNGNRMVFAEAIENVIDQDKMREIGDSKFREHSEGGKKELPPGFNFSDIVPESTP